MKRKIHYRVLLGLAGFGLLLLLVWSILGWLLSQEQPVIRIKEVFWFSFTDQFQLFLGQASSVRTKSVLNELFMGPLNNITGITAIAGLVWYTFLLVLPPTMPGMASQRTRRTWWVLLGSAVVITAGWVGKTLPPYSFEGFNLAFMVSLSILLTAILFSMGTWLFTPLFAMTAVPLGHWRNRVVRKIISRPR